MMDNSCACCRIFGKPQARVNFIIVAGGPDSVYYQRIRRILQTNPDTKVLNQENQITNYESLIHISNRVFNLTHTSPLSDETQTISKNACCYGLSRFSSPVEDESASEEIEIFLLHISNLLNEQANKNPEKTEQKVEPSTWVLLYGSIFLEPDVIDKIMKFKDQSSALVSYTFAFLGLLISEQTLFESWICRNEILEDYIQKTCPQYAKRIQEFFYFLNSCRYFQERTLIIEENRDLTDEKLRYILQNLFQQNPSPHQAINHEYRVHMQRLFQKRHRTVRDVKSVRGYLQSSYQRVAKQELEVLVNSLKQPQRADDAARRVVHLALDDYTFLNREQKRAFKRQIICGFGPADSKHYNTIVSQLVLYALRLIEIYDDSMISLLYYVVVVISEASNHYIFRHELFNNTPEIFTLSLALVSQRHYALVVGGLRLCSKILNGDQNEYKYVSAYLKHDPQTARKILDAIKWLLSPFHQLKELWDQSDEQETSLE